MPACARNPLTPPMSYVFPPAVLVDPCRHGWLVGLQEAERQLFREMFRLVRCGAVSDAQEICLESGHAWAAAALEGIRAFHNYDFDASALHEPRNIVGDMDPRLWRETCATLAVWPTDQMPTASLYCHSRLATGFRPPQRQGMENEFARAVFGVLGGDMETPVRRLKG